MENSNDNKLEHFNNYINKIIMCASTDFFRRDSRQNKREKTIFDDTNFKNYIEDFTKDDENINAIDSVLEKEQLKNAVTKLSDIEQAVLFLYYNQDITSEEAAQILNICIESVSRAKQRALRKLRKILEEGKENEG